MAIIVDASVALKWVIQEPDSAAAIQLVLDEALAAPEFLFVECANVLWTKVRRGVLSASAARVALAEIEATPIRTTSTRAQAAAAHVIAVELGQSAYDSLYLATAIAERSTLVTADAKFTAAALAHPVYQNSVRLLGAS